MSKKSKKLAGTGCLECDHRFTDDVRGRVTCPNCYTPQLITVDDTGLTVVKSLERKPQVKIHNAAAAGLSKAKLVKREKLPDTTPVNVCPICRQPLQQVNSVLGKMRVAFGSTYKEGEPRYSVNPYTGDIVEEITMKKVTFPIMSKVRVCGMPKDCFLKLSEIIPERDRNTLVLPEREFKSPGRPADTPSNHEKPIDPSWMTSRGKRF